MIAFTLRNGFALGPDKRLVLFKWGWREGNGPGSFLCQWHITCKNIEVKQHERRIWGWMKGTCWGRVRGARKRQGGQDQTDLTFQADGFGCCLLDVGNNEKFPAGGIPWNFLFLKFQTLLLLVQWWEGSCTQLRSLGLALSRDGDHFWPQS